MIVVTSWDDGHPLDLRVADLLAKHGLAGTFFVPASNIEGRQVLEPAAIRALGEQFEIGSHTCDHRYLLGLDPKAIEHSIIVGKQTLEDVLGRRVGGFAYPGGRYSAETVQILKQLDIDYARTVENLVVRRTKRRFELPTTIQFFPHSPAAYIRNLLRYRDPLEKMPAMLVAIKHSRLRDRMLALFELAIKNDDGLFHLWGHSWEIEQQGLWRDLDELLGELAKQGAPSVSVGELLGRSSGEVS